MASAQDWAQAWAAKSGSKVGEVALINFAGQEISAAGRVGARDALVHLELSRKFPAMELVAAACRLSLRREGEAEKFENALTEYTVDGDPLWPALARHLARRSTKDDRKLLEDLARHPEKREPPPRWGLQYIVRGDVMLDDGTVVTLDELSASHRLEPLPYLEELPPELEVDWDAEDEPPAESISPVLS